MKHGTMRGWKKNQRPYMKVAQECVICTQVDILLWGGVFNSCGMGNGDSLKSNPIKFLLPNQIKSNLTVVFWT